VVDQHLHDEQPLERREHGLTIDRGGAPGRVGNQAGCEQRHRDRADLADAPVAQPSADAPVVRPKAPVVVHHQTHAAADIRDERRGFGERRRERLLTENREAAVRGQPADWRVGLSRCGHVDRIQIHALPFEHRLH
jgi:hypothetical protein